MLVYGKTVLIILILCIDSFLPLDCRAAIETKEIWQMDDEGSHVKFSLKPPRRLLLGNGYEPSLQKSTRFVIGDTADGTKIAYILLIVLSLLVLIAKCCQKCGSESTDTAGTVTHPPPRTQRAPHLRQPSRQTPQPASRPRILAAPLSSTSMILIREDRPHEALFIGIENPNYRPSNNDNEQRNDDSTPDIDLPPSYDSVVQSQSAYPTSTSVNNPTHSQIDSPPLPLPRD